MADRVQAYLESQVPEYRDLEQKRIFTREELRQMAGRRRDFEYQLMNKAHVTLEPFMRYIQYEMALESLRTHRSRKIGWKTKTLSDIAGIRRLHFLFHRALEKFNHDKPLWYEYLNFCLSVGSTRQLLKAITRGLAYHPHEHRFYLVAANHHVQHKNIKTARIIMLRGVRVLPRSLPLWQELFRLESMQLHRRLLAIQRQQQQQQQRGHNENNENGDTQGEEVDGDRDSDRDGGDDPLSDISPLLSPLGVVVKGALVHLDTAQRDAFRAHVEKLLGSFLDGRSEVDTIRQIFE
ncbi:unnamed protein product [Vitrella brassicaformis CCMP3155]|uniref:U3 small nucleolar RNA-associated protein 6 N-terminal domain-containing protein n=1 Tax=Vitrella brassicaformis (strain CCMP3155) TaxID=1169540 RepID=A0A0G4H026_VITBC|nr:unnamed protein product [Vitrella brassicaformis CCMP3155]|eukprot:CEM36848.1 unnamed protein product [Vitrella brassicaformis CCMP3155]